MSRINGEHVVERLRYRRVVLNAGSGIIRRAMKQFNVGMSLRSREVQIRA